MNRFLYSLIIWLSIPFAIAKLLLKDKHDQSWRDKLKNQLGIVKKIPEKIIWMHCVSVGEFNASKPLIDKLFNLYPNHKIVISTTTMTGAVAVKNHYKNKVIHCFFPFDAVQIIKSFLKKINPEICILMETEIWPNLIYVLKTKHIPVVLVNARLSEKSYDKYQSFSPRLVKKTLNRLSIICAQNTYSLERFISLGINKEKIIETGSLKFDSNDPINHRTVNTLKNMIRDRSSVVFASTRDGEEELIIDSFLKFKNIIDSLLIIVPRHPERFEQVHKFAKQSGLNVKRRSNEEDCSSNTDILIGDSMGEMMAYYSICDIAFIGGSLTDNGSQNMLEPASLSKPVIFGNSVYNFEEISKKLLDNDGAIQVNSSDELMNTISKLLLSKSRREQLGKNAKQTFEKNRGTVNKVLEAISPHFKP